MLAAPSALRLHVEPALLVARLFPFVDGEIRSALLDQLTGDLAVVTEGEGLVGLRVLLALRDPAPVASALPALCETLVTVLRGVGITPVASPEGGCTGALPAGRAALPFLAASVPLRLAVEGKALVLRVGEAGAKGQHRAGAPTTAAQRAMLGAETIALHARAQKLGPEVGAAEALRSAFPLLDPLSLRAVEHWNVLGDRLDETSMALAIGGDGIRLHVDLRTLAGDPEEALAAYEAALKLRDAGDGPGHRAALHAIEARFPATAVARRAALVREGGPWLGAGALALAALMVLERR
jgi:hypothetical protein